VAGARNGTEVREYAGIVFDALGDQVRNQLTLNERGAPPSSATDGRHAPGIHDGRQAAAAAHHLMLAHGLAVSRLRATRPGSEIGIVLNVEPHLAASDSPEDVAAATLADGMHNRFPRAGSPRAVPRRRARPSRRPGSTSAHPRRDLATISAPLDVSASTSTARRLIAARPEPAPVVDGLAGTR
jgi:beta-glucosidase